MNNSGSCCWTACFERALQWKIMEDSPMMNTQNTFCVDSFLEEVSPLSLFSLFLHSSPFHFSYLPYAAPPLSPPAPSSLCEIDPGNHGLLVPEGNYVCACVCVCVCKGLCESPPNPVPLRRLTAQQINTAFPPLLPPYTFSCPKVSTTSQHTKTKKKAFLL